VIAGGVHRYTRIASAFKGIRRVSAVPLPGFARGASLPTSVEAAIDSLAQIVVELAGDEPFVLAGQSSGGKIAYALGKHFEDMHNPHLAGVILIDSYRGSMYEGVLELIVKDYLVEASLYGLDLFYNTVTRLTASVTWSDMLADLYEGPLQAEVLFLQCTMPRVIPDGSGSLAYPLSEPWSPTQTVRTVPTDHASVLVEDSQLAAQIMEEWIRRDGRVSEIQAV
jgi:pimeloyl-ACP methyl ester carboxylesterase